MISRYYSWPEVSFVPLVDAPPATLALAWRRDATNPLISDFARLAGSVAAVAAESRDTPYHLPS